MTWLLQRGDQKSSRSSVFPSSPTGPSCPLLTTKVTTGDKSFHLLWFRTEKEFIVSCNQEVLASGMASSRCSDAVVPLKTLSFALHAGVIPRLHAVIERLPEE